MKQSVAFDVDGTLIDFNGNPIDKNIELYRWFETHGYSMVIWSAAGKWHADEVAQRLDLRPDLTATKNETGGNIIYPDYAVDDLPLHLARTMIAVPEPAGRRV